MAASLAVSPLVASADVLTVRADARAGGALGKGMFGERKDDSFQEGRGSASYGVIAGAEVFFADIWVEHDQYLSGGSVSGTWTQFMLGFDTEIDLGDKKAFSFDDEGKRSGGYNAWMAELGFGAGFGVGTGQQVEPPLDNSEVTDKGFLFEARAMVAYRLTRLMSLGLTVPVQFGYFTKSGDEQFANEIDNHYSAMGGQAMLTFRASWKVK